MISFGKPSFSGRQIFLYLSKAEDNHGGNTRTLSLYSNFSYRLDNTIEFNKKKKKSRIIDSFGLF